MLTRTSSQANLSKMAIRARIFKRLMEPRNQFQGMNSASLCSLAGRYDNPIHPRFLAPMDVLKIPARCLVHSKGNQLFKGAQARDFRRRVFFTQPKLVWIDDLGTRK